MIRYLIVGSLTIVIVSLIVRLFLYRELKALKKASDKKVNKVVVRFPRLFYLLVIPVIVIAMLIMIHADYSNTFGVVIMCFCNVFFLVICIAPIVLIIKNNFYFYKDRDYLVQKLWLGKERVIHYDSIKSIQETKNNYILNLDNNEKIRIERSCSCVGLLIHHINKYKSDLSPQKYK